MGVHGRPLSGTLGDRCCNEIQRRGGKSWPFVSSTKYVQFEKLISERYMKITIDYNSQDVTIEIIIASVNNSMKNGKI